MKNPKVSIVTPLYNSEKYIADTINSVIAQTFLDWEMLIIDDCSTDNSKNIVDQFTASDKRIKYFKTNFQSGHPTTPRNIGISMAKGRFIAFLDSDDLWFPNKLDLQIPLFLEDNVAIVFSNYEKINENGKASGRNIIASEYADYNSLLRGNIIGCSTSVYDSKKAGKIFFTKQGHEDFAFWLSILKRGFLAKNSSFILAKYRTRKNSISSDKFKVFMWYYKIYRINENFSVVRSFFYLVIAISRSFFKYIK
jgi:teichuronic acid biosynthesis glycosyltransferase TuaG